VLTVSGIAISAGIGVVIVYTLGVTDVAEVV